MNLADSHLDLHLSGATALLARRRRLRVPRERIHRAFALRRSFAVDASPPLPCPGWTSRRTRIGVFGFRDSAQLWSAGDAPIVLALYLRGVPYHRIVCDVPDPIREAATINQWLTSEVTTRIYAGLSSSHRLAGEVSDRQAWRRTMDLLEVLTRVAELSREELHIVRKRAEERTAARDHGKDFDEMRHAADRLDHYAHLLHRLHDNEFGERWRHESQSDRSS
jgi:hypothetical protein